MLELNIQQQLGALQLAVNVTLANTGITAIFGLSGAGKTTLINLISGLTRPDHGVIKLNQRTLVDTEQGIYLPAEKRRIGYVFQDARLFPHYKVRGNLQYGMVAKMKSQFDPIVNLLGIEHLLNRYPLTLSGGEKQRVAIGRALLTGPELLLMDEPLASLDLPRKRELLPYLEQLSHEVNTPILYVSHSMEEILRLAQQALVLNEGKVLAFGELEKVWASDALLPWWQKTEQTSVLKVRLDHHHPHYSMSALSLAGQLLWVNRLAEPLGKELHIRIQAADVSLALSLSTNSSIRNILRAYVDSWQQQDESIMVKLRVEQHILWAQITPWAWDELNLSAGQIIFAQIKSVSVSQHIF